MHARLLIPACVLAAAAFAIVRALVVRHHVGIAEYALGSVLAAAFVVGALRLSRHALR